MTCDNLDLVPVGGHSSVENMRREQAQRCKRGGFQNQPCGECWIEQVMRRTYIEATERIEGRFSKSRKEALVVSGGALDTEGLEEDVQTLFRYEEDGTVGVHKWITEVPYDAFTGVVKL